jgi:hypothetical protein
MAGALLGESCFAEALQLIDDALVAIADLNGEVLSLRASIVAKLGAAKILVGEHEEGARLIEAAIPYLDNEDDRTEALLDVAIARLERGLPRAAERPAREAMALALIPRQVRNAHHVLAEVCDRTGRTVEAREHLEAVSRFYPEFDNVRDVLEEAEISALNWKR